MWPIAISWLVSVARSVSGSNDPSFSDGLTDQQTDRLTDLVR